MFVILTCWFLLKYNQLGSFRCWKRQACCFLLFLVLWAPSCSYIFSVCEDDRAYVQNITYVGEWELQIPLSWQILWLECKPLLTGLRPLKYCRSGLLSWKPVHILQTEAITVCWKHVGKTVDVCFHGKGWFQFACWYVFNITFNSFCSASKN